ncbi:MAG: hypothetical protein JWO79_229 [Actinomycetia bacterium]|jgi:membrane protein implicated in regulation of membrane protease activity|nr:hypothetical protein [Actinomycetes bacterium]MDQ1652297.1 hypothetical protein [Cryptosporangiaceae bacterium]MDQ1657908.1 hypothetical protein [Cryptosporangiaceae bacterium]
MGEVTIGFLVLGAVGVVVLATSLLFGELLHLGHLLQLGHVDADGPFSAPAVAGFLGALGFAGALGAVAAGGTGPLALALGAAAGLAAAFPTGWLAVRLTRLVSGMNTDATLTSASLVGARGIVVTPVPAAGYGEVRVLVGGQPLKLNARADGPLATGTSVFVVAMPTESSVVVVQTTPIH